MNNFAALCHVTFSPLRQWPQDATPWALARLWAVYSPSFVSLLSCFCLYKNTFPFVHCVLWVKRFIISFWTSRMLNATWMCFVFEFSEWTFSPLICTWSACLAQLSAPPLSHSFIHSILTEQTLCLRYSAGSLVFRRDVVPDPRGSGFSSTRSIHVCAITKLAELRESWQ